MYTNSYYPYYYNTPQYGTPTPTMPQQYAYNSAPQYNPQQTMATQNANNMQQQNNQQFYASNTNKIYVNGIDDVKNRILPFNSDYIFLDNDKALLYRKVVDNTGKMDVQTFTLAPYVEEAKKQDTKIDMSQYVLKKDFDALKGELERLKSLSQQTNRQAQQNASKPQNIQSSEVKSNGR